jgi:hypothetical protein
VLYLNLTIFNNVSGPTIQQTACDSYTWNGQTYFQSGTYTHLESSQQGCDSTVTLSLTINSAPSNVQVGLNQGTFTVTAQNASTYTWSKQCIIHSNRQWNVCGHCDQQLWFRHINM